MKEQAEWSEEERREIESKAKRLRTWGACCLGASWAILLLMPRLVQSLIASPDAPAFFIIKSAMGLALVWWPCGMACFLKATSLNARIKPRRSKPGCE